MIVHLIGDFSCTVCLRVGTRGRRCTCAGPDGITNRRVIGTLIGGGIKNLIAVTRVLRQHGRATTRYRSPTNIKQLTVTFLVSVDLSYGRPGTGSRGTRADFDKSLLCVDDGLLFIFYFNGC